MNVRAVTAQAFAQVLRDGRSLSLALSDLEEKLDPSLRPRFRYLANQCCRHYFHYLPALEQLIAKPLKPKDQDVVGLLVMGMLELDDPNKADHAAIHETVEAAKALKKDWSKGLLNGVLRGWQREPLDLHRDIRFASHHPGWLAKRIQKQFDSEASQIFSSLNSQAPMTLRVNLGRMSRADYLDQLETLGLGAQPGNLCPSAVILNEPVNVNDLPGFNEGVVSVQDEAAQLSAWLVNPQPGQRILDACCAPGGKTGHLLELGAENLVAVDLEPDRLARVQENLDRIQLPAQLHSADLLDLEAWWDGKPFDHILLDAPCSATGVIRRHPDIKLLRRVDDIAKLAELQLEMLTVLWPLIQPGGRLTFATCSLLKQENASNVDRFLAQNPDARQLPFDQLLKCHGVQDHNWQIAIDSLTKRNGQLTPVDQGHDGFFYTVFSKVS